MRVFGHKQITTMIEQYVNPIIYFNESVFNESLLLSFEYESKSLTIIVDYAHKNASLPLPKGITTIREFRKLKFRDVYNYKREQGLNKTLQLTDGFAAESSKGVHVIQDLKIRYKNGNYNIWFWLGHAFGGVEFSFLLLSVEYRLGIAKKNAQGDFDYYDEQTNQQFNFYRPFEL